MRTSLPRFSCVLIVLAAGCQQPPLGNSAQTGSPGDAGAPVSEETLPTFAAHLDAALNEAARTLVQIAPSGLPAPSARPIVQTHRTVVERLDGLALAGTRGMLTATGVRFMQQWPARYELTLLLDNYGAGDALGISGVLEYNFVLDDSVDPPLAYGLYRGALDLAGSFGGHVDIHGAVTAGRAASLHVSTGAADLEMGGPPQPFLAYVSTIAGNGKEGYADGPAGQARFNRPHGVAVDDDGRIYVADTDNGMIREIATDGTVSTLTRDLGQPWDLDIDAHGDLVVTQWLNADAPLARIARTGPSKGALTPIIGPQGVTASGFPMCGPGLATCDGRSPIATMPHPAGLDVQDNLIFVAQQWAPPSIRAVLPDGYVMTLKETGSLCGFGQDGTSDVARGYRGETYFVMNTPFCYGVFVLDPDGQVRLIAGNLREFDDTDGAGDAARFFNPSGLVFDQERYLYVADSGNSLIRRVDVETGEVVRVAGCLAHRPGFECTSQDGFRDGPADSAQFDLPTYITMDRWGDLYVGDTRNHAVRMIRIIADPERKPIIQRIDPQALLRGAQTSMTLWGRNLTMADAVDFGPGVQAQILSTGYRYVRLNITVDPGAAPGERSASVTTPYGAFTTPSDLSLTIIDDAHDGPFVETIAGTGDVLPDRANLGPAGLTTFAFPGGMHALSEGRVLVADPLEQRIRLIATRVGAAEEISDLLVATAVGQDLNILSTVLDGLGEAGKYMRMVGIQSVWVDRRESEIRRIARESVDHVCSTIGADCTWLSLPWAGVPFVPGRDNGFRMSARFFLPTDITQAANGLFYVSDLGNQTIRVIGYDRSRRQDAPNQVFDSAYQPDYPLSVAASEHVDAGKSAFTTIPGAAVVTRLGVDANSVQREWAGVYGYHAGQPNAGDTKQPLGVPMGIAARAKSVVKLGTERSFFVADPFVKTIWKIEDNAGAAEVRDLKGDIPVAPLGPCADGPISLASWGAPADVALSGGDIYVADCGCNSIRVIRDYSFGRDAEGVAGQIRSFIRGHSGRLPVKTVNWVEEKLRNLDSQFIEENRYWVTTLAGSPAGDPGFRDGPAATALFNAPTGIAVATQGETTVIFVSDTANRRIRRIVIP